MGESKLEQRVFIEGPLPGMNYIIALAKVRRGRYSKYAQEKREWEERVIFVCKAHKLKPVQGRVYFDFIWYEKNKRRDPDNISASKKFILDALVKAGILPDDNWKYVAGFKDRFCVADNGKRAGVLVIMREGKNGSGSD